MSDEAKKRSWAWGWWMAILMLAYPLSAGPAIAIIFHYPRYRDGTEWH
jgi:hypothetical protein